jgi:hypothetical protein
LGVLISFSILFPNTARLRFDPCLLNVPSRLEYFNDIFNFKSPDGDSMVKIRLGLRSQSCNAVSILNTKIIFHEKLVEKRTFR